MVDFEPSADRRRVPSNVDAERAVLGALLLHPDTVGEVSQVLRAADFYQPPHRLIFEAILETFDQRALSDVIAVEEALLKRGRLDEAGGREALWTWPPACSPLPASSTTPRS